MREIVLSKGKVAFVDNDDYERLSEFKWCYNNYAIRTVHKGKTAKRIIMHRSILGLDNAPEFTYVDHINGNKLDNRKVNLRIANHTTNGQNRKNSVKNTTGFKGVHFVARLGKFYATLRIDRKKTYLGAFLCPRRAAIAYNRAAIKYYGEFARLNKIFGGKKSEANQCRWA